MDHLQKNTDNWISIAQIYKIQGKHKEDANAYLQVLGIVKNDYQLNEGKDVDEIMLELSKLQK